MTIVEETLPKDFYLGIYDDEYGSFINDKFQLRLEKPPQIRSWKTLTQAFYLTTMKFSLESVKIDCKSRSEPSCSIPNNMFSSLKYILEVSLPISFFGKEILMIQVQVVDYTNPQEEISKEGRSILKETKSIHTFSVDSIEQRCKMKLQFNDSSFHYKKKEFAFKISILNPTLSQQPILVLLSPPFKVYARKPQSKRKDIENENREVKKVKRESGVKDNYQDFQKTLKILVQKVENLNEEQKKEAIDTIKKNFKIDDQFQTPSFDIFNDLVD